MGVGVEGRTPDYMVREELQREKMRNKAVRRAWSFEERLTGGRKHTGTEMFGGVERDGFERGVRDGRGRERNFLRREV